MNDAVDVTVVVVTWNSGDVLGGLLDSLVEHPPKAAIEVLVVDNGSADDSIAIAQSRDLAVEVAANGRNRGLPAANNQGLASARGEFVLVCNPDIVPAPGAIDALVDCARRHPRAAFVVAKLVHPDGALQSGVGDLPSFGEAFRGRRSARLRAADTGFWWDGWAHDEERCAGHGQEACYLVRRSALAEVGVQDERFRLDWEGLDWAARAADAGWEIWFCPSAVVVHLGGTSIRKAKLRWVVWSHLGMYRFFAPRSSRLVRPLMAAAIVARALVKTVMLLRPDLYQRGLRVDRRSTSG